MRGSHLAAQQLMDPICIAIVSRLGLVDEVARPISKLPPPLDCDLALRVKAELYLKLSKGHLNQGRPNKTPQIQVWWHPVHSVLPPF